MIWVPNLFYWTRYVLMIRIVLGLQPSYDQLSGSVSDWKGFSVSLSMIRWWFKLKNRRDSKRWVFSFISLRPSILEKGIHFRLFPWRETEIDGCTDEVIGLSHFKLFFKTEIKYTYWLLIIIIIRVIESHTHY